MRAVLLGYLTRWAGVRPDLGGRELLAAGVAPGPEVARALDAALALKLDRPGSSREEQLQAALRAAGASRRRGG